jgi:hypothetical protein
MQPRIVSRAAKPSPPQAPSAALIKGLRPKPSIFFTICECKNHIVSE